MRTAKVKLSVIVVLGAALLGGGMPEGLSGGQGSGGLQAAQAAALDMPRAETAQSKGSADGVKPAVGPETPDAPQFSSARIGRIDFRFPGRGMIAGFPDGRRALLFEPNENKPARLVDL